MKYLLLPILVVLGAVSLVADYAAAQSSFALKICANTKKNTLVVRVKCKSGETALKATSFAGPAGAQGATGDRGASAFDAIPSGTTVYGVIGLDVEAPLASGDFSAFASLPAKTSQILTDADILLASTPVLAGCSGECRLGSAVTSGAVCTGTAANPTAPAGKLCIYISSLSSSRIPAGGVFSTVFPVSGTPTVTPGFRVIWTINAVGDTFLKGTWAYTAP